MGGGGRSFPWSPEEDSVRPTCWIRPRETPTDQPPAVRNSRCSRASSRRPSRWRWRRRRDRDRPVSRQRPGGQRGRAGRHRPIDRGRHRAAPRTRGDRDGGGPSDGGRLRRLRRDVHFALRRLRGARQLLADAGDRDRRATGRRVDLHAILVSGSARGRLGARLLRGAHLRQLAGGRPVGHDRILARPDQGRRVGAVRRARRAGRVRPDRRARDRPRESHRTGRLPAFLASQGSGSAAVS